jgi:hypothetical protein
MVPITADGRITHPIRFDLAVGPSSLAVERWVVEYSRTAVADRVEGLRLTTDAERLGVAALMIAAIP